jgi:N-acetylglucosamine kinase-like BadF-type ATPase
VGESCERLLNVIADLCEQANIDSAELDAVVIGLAGVWLEEEKKRSTHLLKTLARGQKITLNDLLVTSDAELALEGAFEGGQGIMMIVGTGSIALAKSGSRITRCGGWGIELDDEGSGAWIGREGLTAVVRAVDGRGKATKLTNILREFNPMINLDQPRTIVKAYAERSFEYHMLTPSVMKCAEEGDEVCEDIIKRASFHLVEHVNVMQGQFKTKTVPVALMGGIMEADTLLARLLRKELSKNHRIEIVKPKGSALDGALNIGIKLIEEME